MTRECPRCKRITDNTKCSFCNSKTKLRQDKKPAVIIANNISLVRRPLTLQEIADMQEKSINATTRPPLPLGGFEYSCGGSLNIF